MEGHVVPYLKEVRLAGNLPSQLQGMYVRCCIFTCIRAILKSTPRVECTQVTSLFRLATSNFTLFGQLRRHQVLVHSQAHHEFFVVHIVRVQWCTRVFLKFKLNYTVVGIAMKMYGFWIFHISKNHLTTDFSNLNALVLL